MHYKIAGYDALIAWSTVVNKKEVVASLQVDLHQEKTADTPLALLCGSINPEAAKAVRLSRQLVQRSRSSAVLFGVDIQRFLRGHSADQGKKVIMVRNIFSIIRYIRNYINLVCTYY